MTKRHYIGGSGSYGCLYDYCSGACPSVTAAAEALAAVHELGSTRRRRLIRERYLDLSDGADYCEIVECDCATPEQHDND